MIKEWQKPKTTRMYLHPPKCERMYTLWREGKLIFGEIEKEIKVYENNTSAGAWFFSGDGNQLDFQSAEFAVREDGIPTHALNHKIGNLDMTLLGFATAKRKSECYLKLTLKNNTDHDATERFGFYLRTAKECELVYESPDVYAPYKPDISVWAELPATWRACDGGYTDGERMLASDGGITFDFDEKLGKAVAEITLSAGECREVVFAYDIGLMPSLDFDLKLSEVVEYWEGELSRITKLPRALSPEKVRLIKNLTVQLLQCFCYSVDEKFLLSRQGGLQRQIWTYESMLVLEALCRIGNFDDYIEPVIDSYFNEYYTDSGEIVPLGISWAMITGTVLYSFGKYSVHRGLEFFKKYRDRAYNAFKWMKSTRASSVETDTLAKGIFPPKSSCDDPLVFQSWGNTDTFNMRGLSALADAFRFFGDEAADEVAAEYEDYLSVMRALWKKISDATDADEIEVPYSPKLPNSLIASRFVFGAMSAYMVEGLDMDERDAERILNYYTRRGFIKGGMYNRMPDKRGQESTRFNLDENGKCTVWYVACHEYYWFKYFMRHGKKARAAEIIGDCEKYAMTDEYYMIERYNVIDPWFAPWSPNASANGRMINMLLDFHEEK